MRILICDDTEALRRELRLGLEAEGFQVVGEAADGVEAERMGYDLRPDAFVVDLSMPRRDGLELIPLLRAAHPEARIVVFSGFDAARMRNPALRLGADVYLEKGAPFSELVEALLGEPPEGREAIDRRHAPGGRPHAALDRVIAAHEGELARAAGELHDGPVQTVTAALMLLQSATGDAARLGRLLPQITELLGDSVDAMRNTMSDLAPWDLHGGSFEDVVGTLVAHRWRIAGPEADIEVGGVEGLPAGHCSVVFRTVQEAVSNVIRHADAQNVGVAVSASVVEVTVEVRDDGIGFDTDLAVRPGHFGIPLMRQRVESLGGRLEIRSRPGAGTRVHAQVPRTA